MSLYTLDTSRTSEQGFVNTNHNPANMNRNFTHYIENEKQKTTRNTQFTTKLNFYQKRIT